MDLSCVRKKEHCTQQTLADRIGITRQMISAIENKITLPSPEVAMRIAASLNFEKYGIHWSDLLIKESSFVYKPECPSA